MNRFLNKVLCGDCLDIMQDMPDHSVDLILSDLPYGQTSHAWDKRIDLDRLWEQYKRVAKDNAAILLTAKGQFMFDLVNSNREQYRYEWIWDKDKGANFTHVRNRPLCVHEFVLVFYDRQPTYNPQMGRGRPYRQKRLQRSITGLADNLGRFTTVSDGQRYPKSVIRVEGQAQRDILYPTQKPVGLFEYLIRTYSNEGDIVLDSCAGSGTTAVVCKRTMRRFIAIDLNPEACRIAEERLSTEEMTVLSYLENNFP